MNTIVYTDCVSEGGWNARVREILEQNVKEI